MEKKMDKKIDKKLLGEKLKESRKNSNMSVNQVADALREFRTIQPKTIYGWENGNTQPDANTLLHLCDIYKVSSVMEFSGYHIEEEPLILTDTEKDLIHSYRDNPEMQPAVQKLLECTRNKKKS